MLNKKAIVGVDVGNLISGMTVLVGGQISSAENCDNRLVFEKITSLMRKYDSLEVVIEDIKPYAGNLSQQAIDTCKFIGQLTWRLDEIGKVYAMMPRYNVRRWVYDTFWELIIPLVNVKIEKKNKKLSDGKNRKPSFVYVDDGMVKKAMILMWNVPTPPPGYGYIHGLKDHSWQALALASCLMHSNQASEV